MAVLGGAGVEVAGGAALAMIGISGMQKRRIKAFLADFARVNFPGYFPVLAYKFGDLILATKSREIQIVGKEEKVWCCLNLINTSL